MYCYGGIPPSLIIRVIPKYRDPTFYCKGTSDPLGVDPKSRLGDLWM